MSTIQPYSWQDLVPFGMTSAATYINKQGLLVTSAIDEPRIEYDKDGNRLGLLIEREATNLWQGSVPFQYNSLQNNEVVATSETVSPEGTNNSYALLSTTNSTTYKIVRQNINGIIADEYGFSVFAKQRDAGIHLELLTNTGTTPDTNAGCVVNLSNGQVLDEVGGTTTVVPLINGWYRIEFFYVASGNNNVFDVRPTSASTFNITSLVPEGQGIYVYGPQVEQCLASGGGVTSYIPTQSGQTATRAAPFNLRIATNPSNIGQQSTISNFAHNNTAFTIYVEVSRNRAGGYSIVLAETGSIQIHVARQNNEHSVSFQNNTDNLGNTFSDAIGGSRPGSVSSETPAKIAVAYSGIPGDVNNSSASAAINGNLATDSSVYQAKNPNWLEFGSWYGNKQNGHIKEVRVYPRRLTDAQLQEITS